MRETNLGSLLLPDIAQPSFLEDLVDPMGLTVIQSTAGFYSPPKYERYEQFLCAVDGMV